MRDIAGQCPRQKVHGRNPILVHLAKESERTVDATVEGVDGLGSRVEVPGFLTLLSLLLLLHLCQTVLCLGVYKQTLMLRLHLAQIAQVEQVLRRQRPHSILVLEVGREGIPIPVELAEDPLQH